MDSIRLPLEEKPMIKTYLRQAFPLSILLAEQADYYKGIIINDHIQLIAAPHDDNRLDYHNYHYSHWPNISYNRMPAAILRRNQIDIVSYIYSGLQEGYYSDIWLDTFYIPGKPTYGKEHYCHGLLIFGYSQESDEFLSMTYTNQLQYSQLKVKADDIRHACDSEKFAYINLLKKEPGAGIDYDLKSIMPKLQGYLNSCDFEMNDKRYHRASPGEPQYYGVQACKWFRDYIDVLGNAGNEETGIDMRLPYCFAEHKKCMTWRIKLIADTANLKLADSNLDATLKEIEYHSELVVNLSLKYNMNGDTSLKERIIQEINGALDLECETLLRLLDELNICMWQYLH